MNEHCNKELEEIIDLFEKFIKSYKNENGKETSEARKLIQIRFKEQLDKDFSIGNNFISQ